MRVCLMVEGQEGVTWEQWRALARAAEDAGMVARGEQGSVVTLMCDPGNRYACSHQNDAWLAGKGLDPSPHERTIEHFLDTGVWEQFAG